MKPWGRIDCIFISLPFATKILWRFMILGWESVNELRCNKIYKYLTCETKDYCGLIRLCSGDWGQGVWMVLNLFYWKLLTLNLTALKTQNHFQGITYLVSDNSLIKDYQSLWKLPVSSLKTMKNTASIFNNILASLDTFFH